MAFLSSGPGPLAWTPGLDPWPPPWPLVRTLRASLGAMPPEVFIGAVVVAKLALDLGALALGPDFA